MTVVTFSDVIFIDRGRSALILNAKNVVGEVYLGCEVSETVIFLQEYEILLANQFLGVISIS